MDQIPTLILLPGMDGTGRLFRWLNPEVASVARIVAVAYPPDRFLDYRGLADLVAAQIPAGPHVILAESFSGPIAALVAARRISGLCGIIFSTSFVAPPAPRWLKAAALDFWFRIPPPHYLLRHLLLDWKCEVEVVDEVAAAIRTVEPIVLAARLRQLLTVNASEDLQSSPVPILALVASRDRLIGGRGIETIRNARPDATVVTLDGPHLLLQTRAHAAAEVIRWELEGWFAKRQP